MIYENVPTLVIEAVRSIYDQSYVDLDAYGFAGIEKFIDTNVLVGNIFIVLSWVSLVLCVLFSAFIIMVVVRRRMLQVSKDASAPESSTAELAPAMPLRERWSGIVRHLDSTREADWKIAVIEADKLVDDALARAGFSGETFGDRLSNIQPEALLSLDGVWWAHKIRNRLAHESDYFLRYTEARQALGYYEAALTELQLI